MTDLLTISLLLGAVACALAVIYPYAVYPALLLLLRKRPIERGRPDAADGRQFSMLFCAFNEAESMPAKLANMRELKARYPQLSIHAFDDGSDDGTADMIERDAPFISLVRGGGRNGKAHGMKLLAAAADTEYLVFTDANVLLDLDALDALAACYADPAVGGVCGALKYLGAEGSATASVGGKYWQLDEKLKDLESATGSVMGADGSIFSIRRALYPQFPDTVLDDLTVSMECVFRGYRLVKSNDVIAYERLVSARSDEFARKIRIAARAFGTHRYLREKRREMSRVDRFKYASHKTIRWFGGAYLILGTVLGIAAAAIVAPMLGLALLLVLALLLSLGYHSTRGPHSAVTELVLALIATLVGVVRALRGQTMVTWNPAKSRSPSGTSAS
ncbi:glycosyltransferase [Mycolicibacterium diernhoferi]|uniref:Histidine kinase n=1 Tax=Mycolicibacterium diernhoferi TaxID=1801 RepID=A0A1Q4HCJ4_9MYCO|nr:glycosyltransferase [Mycolicibacterium diernhoferi]OJZ65254.1 histidine kinase [Mycolicibacterium diernhoferi]OPE55388.1 histidine kinase [Mycolicibacterium diernhoferi]PEG52288.1 histidine kinase [Mycolicibacterium diernhoferi]QYL23733.1 glycosyltransferase [Mycolicibacterium diernhoferi]